MLVCVFDLIRFPREERDMKPLTMMFVILVGMMVWTFFNGYPTDYVVFPMVGLFVLLWAVEELEWKRTR